MNYTKKNVLIEISNYTYKNVIINDIVLKQMYIDFQFHTPTLTNHTSLIVL